MLSCGKVYCSLNVFLTLVFVEEMLKLDLEASKLLFLLFLQFIMPYKVLNLFTSVDEIITCKNNSLAYKAGVFW